MHTYIHPYTCVNTHACTHIHTCIHAMHIYMHTHACMYTHECVHTNIDTMHIHSHTGKHILAHEPLKISLEIVDLLLFVKGGFEDMLTLMISRSGIILVYPSGMNAITSVFMRQSRKSEPMEQWS